MLFTTKSSYGIRALIDLSIVYERKEPISIKNIAKIEGISVVYLEQLFNKMKKAGIVKSARGPKGGYLLAKNPRDFNIYDAVKTLEEGKEALKCGMRRGHRHCKLSDKCASREVWEKLDEKIAETLGEFDFSYLAQRALEKDPQKREKLTE